MPQRITDTRLKALEVNLAPHRYGTFAEIGAGQEVVRWFFAVGAASGTVAKSISAYDMEVSDAIYGKSDRYVSRSRLETMLHYEYELNIDRLSPSRGRNTALFAFADTVAARTYRGNSECHAWMGIRFQAQARDDASQIVIHVRMRDVDNLQQQQALGIVGVNLVYGASFLAHEPEDLLESLLDGLSTNRIEIDMVEFSGIEFRSIDNRVMSLRLVQLGLSDAAMFASDGHVLQPAEVLYKKPVLVQRGSFKPATNVHLDLQRCAFSSFQSAEDGSGDEAVSVLEITMSNLLIDGKIDLGDFLDRVDMLSTTDFPVLISNYSEHYRLVEFLLRHTHAKIGLALGAPTLQHIFDPRHYSNLEGGVLEAIGRLCKRNVEFYVYPALNPDDDSLLTAENLNVAPEVAGLHRYIFEQGVFHDLKDANRDYLAIRSSEVLAMLQHGKSGWESMVPEGVANAIKSRKLFGVRSRP